MAGTADNAFPGPAWMLNMTDDPVAAWKQAFDGFGGDGSQDGDVDITTGAPPLASDASPSNVTPLGIIAPTTPDDNVGDEPAPATTTAAQAAPSLPPPVADKQATTDTDDAAAQATQPAAQSATPAPSSGATAAPPQSATPPASTAFSDDRPSTAAPAKPSDIAAATDSSGQEVPSVRNAIVEGLRSWASAGADRPFSKYIYEHPEVVQAIALDESTLTWNAHNPEERAWGPFSILEKFAPDLWSHKSKAGTAAATMLPVTVAGDWGPALTTYPSAIGYALVKVAQFTDWAYTNFTISGDRISPRTSKPSVNQRRLIDTANTYATQVPSAPMATLLQLFWKASSLSGASNVAQAEGSRIAKKVRDAILTLRGNGKAVT